MRIRWLLLLLSLVATALQAVIAEDAFDGDHRTEREAVANLEAYAYFKSGDHDAARAIWERLAEAGNTTAMWNLANLLQQRYDSPGDNKKALEYIRAAAESGDPRAQHELGIAYEKGTVLERDLKQASDWLLRSARQNYADSQLALGILLATEYGRGVEFVTPANRRQALIWLRRATQEGSEEAKNYIKILEAQNP